MNSRDRAHLIRRRLQAHARSGRLARVMLRRGSLLLMLPLSVAGTLGCTAIATAPTWTGGGMAVTGPIRIAQQETLAAAERQRLASQPQQVGARHILVMHVGSKTRSESITRSRDEAKARAQQCLVELRGGADFGQMVVKYSDEPGSAERAGDLGVFRREVMVKAFSDVAFALKVGQISEVVETPFGFHIIKRTR